MKMANILITGARGFIGRHLASWLNSKGCTVFGLGHGLWPAEEAGVWGVSHWFNGEIEPGNLKQLHKTCGTIDVVYHLAGGSSVGSAVSSPREDFFRTVATTAELLEWLRVDTPSTRLVAVSSAAVYGSGHEGAISEADALRPYSPYGHHKRIMEELCRSYADSYGLVVGIARLFSVYGPELKKQLLWDTCTRISAGERPLILGGSGDELRDWTDVRDVVRALDLMGTLAATDFPIFNIGTGQGTSVREIATSILSCWKTAGADKSLQFSGQSRPGDPFSLIANPTLLNKHGFTWEISVDAGIANYVRWFKDQVRIPV